MPLTLHLPPCPGDASAEATSNIATYRFQQGQSKLSSLLAKPCSPARHSRRLHSTDMSNESSQSQEAPGAHLRATITFITFERELGYSLTLFTSSPPTPKESLFLPLLLPSKWTQLPMELTHFPETCNYTGCCVSALITLPVPHGDGRQAGSPPFPASLPCLPSLPSLPKEIRAAIPRRAPAAPGGRRRLIVKMGPLKAQRQISPENKPLV